MAKFRYLKTTKQFETQCMKIKSWLISGDACYGAKKNHLFNCLLHKIINTKLQRIIILPAILYGRKTSFLYWGKNTGWVYSKTRYWARYLGIRWRKKHKRGENCVRWNFPNCMAHQILRYTNQGEWDERDLWHYWERREMHKEFGEKTWSEETTLNT